MNSFASSSPPSGARGLVSWLSRAEAWLDDKGKGAWLAVVVVSFVLFWPLGLALLAYMIWSKKMICSSARRGWGHGPARHAASLGRATGNTAFDAYRADTLARLEREQADFEAFLQRLRDARDKAEFDQFMDDRARAAASADNDAGTGKDAGPDAPTAG